MFLSDMSDRNCRTIKVKCQFSAFNTPSNENRHNLHGTTNTIQKNSDCRGASNSIYRQYAKLIVTKQVSKKLKMLTVQFAADLSSSFRCRKATVSRLWPLIDVLHLKIHLAAVQSCFVRAIKDPYL